MNVTLKYNTADDDGGIYYDNSNPSLKNVTIVGNEAGDDGAGVCCFSNSNPNFKNTIVSSNTGNYGIYVSSGNPSIMYCDFYANEIGNFHGC